MSDDVRYVVVERSGKFRVFREDDPRAVGGVVFPATESKSAYERARAWADSCNEDRRTR